MTDPLKAREGKCPGSYSGNHAYVNGDGKCFHCKGPEPGYVAPKPKEPCKNPKCENGNLYFKTGNWAGPCPSCAKAPERELGLRAFATPKPKEPSDSSICQVCGHSASNHTNPGNYCPIPMSMQGIRYW